MKTVYLKMLLATLLAIMLFANPARAQQLLMLEQAGCTYCEQWDKEIGEIYPKTWEGKAAPLRRVDIHEPWPQDLSQIKPDIFTPTFVLIAGGEEIGRLRGYAGDQFFWFLLDELLEKLEK
ncbi:transcriptional regulator [Maritalea sp.]|uniref:transcriptional regulator n=1 Tax=Maritalea sp. TaxID=2003361 RepID=UPI003EF9F46D